MFHPPAPRRHTMVLAASCLASVAMVGAACGSDSGDGLQATGAWARTSPSMADTGVAYMTLGSDEAATIVSASVPSEVAGRAELHETVAVGTDDDSMSDDAMSDDSMGDMAMTMQPVDSLEIPAGGELTLEPGGYHIMLLDLADPLETGETFDITLTGDDGTEITVAVEVRDEAP